jgi:hypothetical protein
LIVGGGEEIWQGGAIATVAGILALDDLGLEVAPLERQSASGDVGNQAGEKEGAHDARGKRGGNEDRTMIAYRARLKSLRVRIRQPRERGIEMHMAAKPFAGDSVNGGAGLSMPGVSLHMALG